jgi:hypothetical protein
MTLIEFLLERFAEDEDAARGPLAQKWFAVGTEFPGNDSHPSEMLRGYVDSQGLAVTEDGDGPSVWHITRWDPARVLAECEVKRRIVEHITNVERYADGSPGIGGIDPDSLPAVTHILRLLALPSADHPDYQPEWRV